MADSGDSASPSCESCGKTTNDLKRCAKCQTTRYCNRDCQKTHWKAHKKVCATLAAIASIANASSPSPPPSNAASNANAPPPTKALIHALPAPFHALNAGTWLHNRPEPDVYALLIDSLRLRLDDDYKFSALATPGSVFAGAPTSLRAFRTFLNRVEAVPGLLPPWWSPEKRAACEALGCEEGSWLSLAAAPEKGDIVERYGDGQMPMQMRMFVEGVYGSGPGGQDGSAMRALMMATEQGTGPEHVSMMDASGNFRRGGL